MIKFLGIPVAYETNISHGTQCEASSILYIREVLFFLLNLVSKVLVSASSFLPQFLF